MVLDEAVAIAGRIVRAAQRRLGAVAQAGERRLQVVGDVVGHLAQRRHQLLDARQHGVEALRQPVELVAGAGQRDAAGEVAGHDLAAGLADGSMRVSTLRLISRPAPMPSSDSSPTLHSATCHMVSANWRWSSMSRPTTSV